jgi:hypothetical protein
MSEKRKSPLKDPPPDAPFRFPGQSTAKQIEDVKEETIEMYALLTAAFSMILLTVWMAWFVDFKITLTNPVVPIIICVSIVPTLIYFFFMMVWLNNALKKRRQMRNLRLSFEAKFIVGQHLESLRDYEYEVLHDIPGNGFTIDHVVIAPNGIFAIETKSLRKEKGQQAPIDVEHGKISINGKDLGKHMVFYAAVHAHWLHEQIRNGIACEYPVQPIIVFPEWQVNGKKTGAHGAVVVLNHTELHDFIERKALGEKVLLKEEIGDLMYFLTTMARSAGD